MITVKPGQSIVLIAQPTPEKTAFYPSAIITWSNNSELTGQNIVTTRDELENTKCTVTIPSNCTAGRFTVTCTVVNHSNSTEFTSTITFMVNGPRPASSVNIAIQEYVTVTVENN